MFSKIGIIWREDTVLRRVLKNSGHLLSANVISAALGFLQGILAVRLIGITDWGLVTTVITFASNINRLLTFRMSEVVVKRLSISFSQSTPKAGVAPISQASPQAKLEAAASVKTAMLVEIATSISAYLVLFFLSTWAANSFAKNIQTAPLFLFYGLILLTNLVAESSTGVLQAMRRFHWIARINIIQSLATAGLIFYAYLSQRGIYWVVLAYVVGKSINGIGLGLMAFWALNKTLTANWWKVSLKFLPERRSMFKFILNTNLNGTVNLFTRDNIPLYLAGLLSTTQVGYYKLAQSLINLILLPLDPLIWPTYAEISKTVAQKQWDATRQLLKRVSIITGTAVSIIGGFLALTGWFVLPLLYGEQARPAYPVLLILLVGYGFASVFQWNRPLWLALGKPGFPVLVSLIFGLVELGLIFTLVPTLGYLALAGILSGYFVISIGTIVWRGFAEINRQSLSLSEWRTLL
ncbi:MAG: oligosaccharide flippase family protein [Chloroflexota bacterium]